MPAAQRGLSFDAQCFIDLAARDLGATAAASFIRLTFNFCSRSHLRRLSFALNLHLKGCLLSSSTCKSRAENLNLIWGLLRRSLDLQGGQRMFWRRVFQGSEMEQRGVLTRCLLPRRVKEGAALNPPQCCHWRRRLCVHQTISSLGAEPDWMVLLTHVQESSRSIKKLCFY